MKILPASLVILAFATLVSAADNENFGGEYAAKRHLNGTAVFQLSITQNGNEAQVSFDAVYNDGHGAAPEADGKGKIVGHTLKFTFTDNFGNAGNGIITRTSDGVILSLHTTRVADSRCLALYGQNMRLERSGKK